MGLFPIIREAREIMEKEGEGKNLLLLDVKKASTTYEGIEALKQFSKSIQPLLIKSAIINLTGIQGFVLNLVKFYSKTKIKKFKTLEEAKDYLVSD